MKLSDDGQAALLAFHAALNAVEDVAKTETADTGRFSYRYVPLAGVLDECKRVCQLHELSLFQSVTATDGLLSLTTHIIHSSGGHIAFDPIQLPLPRDAQPLGSAITYLRRYSLMTIFAISTEDDDGKAATQAARTQAETGYRSGAEKRIRDTLATLPEPTAAKIRGDFRDHFNVPLSGLPTNRHGEALEWVLRAVAAHAGDEADEQFIADARGQADAEQQEGSYT